MRDRRYRGVEEWENEFSKCLGGTVGKTYEVKDLERGTTLEGITNDRRDENKNN